MTQSNPESFPRPLPATAVTLPVAIVALAGAIVLGLIARGPNVLGWDVDITVAVQRMDGRVSDAAADIANVLGSTWFAAPAISVALVIAAVKRAWPTLLFLISLLVLRLAGTQVKPIFDSPRPTEDLVTIIGTWEGTGYPSGHAMSSSTLALGLAVIAWQWIPSRPLARIVIGVLVAYTLLVGWARIWTGAHWASDVIGGYLFGIAIVALSVLIVERFSRNRQTPAAT